MTTDYKTIALAVSRGARVQFKWSWSEDWRDTKILNPRWCESGRQRVHPEDHLCRFGPISRALYDAAQEPPESLEDAMPVFPLFLTTSISGDFYGYDRADRDTRQWFLLIMAEALSMEGL